MSPPVSLSADLRREAALDQVARLVLGVPVFLLLLTTIGLTTRYSSEHPTLFWCATAGILAGSAIRLALFSVRFRLESLGERWFRALLILNVCFISGASSLLYVTDLWFYGLEDWNFTIVMAFVVGIASGSMISFTPSYGLLRLHLLILIGPTLVLGCFQPSGKAVVIVVCHAILIVVLLAHGKRLNQTYWDQLLDRDLKAARTREMDEARKTAEAASVAKSQFLANMSHEIRTPMHAILGMSELAMAPGTQLAECRQYLQQLHGCAEGLLNVLNDILDFSKIEAGKLTVEKIPFSLRALLNQTYQVIRPPAAAKGLSLTFTVADDVPDSLLGDPARLRQVLVNLLGNATKFTEAGSVTLEVTAAGGGSLLFRVSDTGIGIPLEQQSRIFDAFAQADMGTTRRFGGTGLGLSICSQLVGLMGGRLWVESTPHAGSTFRFTCALAAGQRVDSPASVAADAPRLSPMRVLLAEDHPVSRLLASKILAAGGHSVTAVENGRAAVAAWEAEPFDLILMDNQMPEMGGIDAIRAIRGRERARDGGRTPIVALTASAMVGDREQFLAAGADGYLAKPFRAQELYATLEEIYSARSEDTGSSREARSAGR